MVICVIDSIVEEEVSVNTAAFAHLLSACATSSNVQMHLPLENFILTVIAFSSVLLVDVLLCENKGKKLGCDKCFISFVYYYGVRICEREVCALVYHQIHRQMIGVCIFKVIG